jgi:HD-GYP domain-containing protein (c-di-GMP phosphodiesterase class II)
MRSHQKSFLMIVSGTLALAVLIASWTGTPPAEVVNPQHLFVGLFLILCVIAADLYPIHLRYHTKVAMMSVPLYLMAVLLPPPLAALAAGLGWLIGETLVRRERRNRPSDIAITTARWVVVAFLGSQVAHLPIADPVSEALILLGTAAVLFLGDALSVSFQIALMSGEPPWRIVVAIVREGGLAEGVQYLIGLLGALAALQEIWALLLLTIPTAIAYFAFKNIKEMRSGTRQVLESMADAVDLRDPYTGGHSRRVAPLCAQILNQMGIFGPEADLIVSAARVHDIGKIGIPDEILKKPGRLTPEEKALMDSHAERGAELLARYPDFARGVEIVRHHHERWDGKGYPSRIGGLDIPFGARVVAVADSFDAMTSDRPYRRAFSVQQAAMILRQERGRQWDPTIVDTFLSTIASQLGEATPVASDIPVPSLESVRAEAAV